MSKRARQLANALLDKYWDKTLPIDIEAIADNMGLEIDFNDDINQRLSCDDDISGALVYEEGCYTCVINNKQHQNRQRFTLAHEIGHFVLNHGEKYDRATTLYRKDGGISQTDRGDEIEANVFASELLMPERAIYYLTVHQGMDGITQLAGAFGVSEQAMHYRLKATGWI